MRTIDTIDNEPINEDIDGKVHFNAKAAIDGDGVGSPHGDPDYQPNTSLRLKGEYLNADEDKYIAIPPQVIHGVAGIVLGCQVHIKDTITYKETDAVVGDIGPHRKIGEISIACAKALGINPSPTSGGEDRHVIEYQLWPGRHAIVDGKEYDLQPS